MRWVGVLGLVLLGACLPEGAPIDGEMLLEGRHARRPVLARSGSRWHVIYETSKPPGAAQPWSPQLWSIPLEGGRPIKLAENGTWPVAWEPEGGVAVVLHDLPGGEEQPVFRWFPGTNASLSRVDLTTGRVLHQQSNVVDFGFWNGQLYVENMTTDRPLRQLVVPGRDGRREVFLPAAEVRWSARQEAFLLVPGDDPALGMLVRASRPGVAPEVLQRGATEFLLHPTENLVLVTAMMPAGLELTAERRLLELETGRVTTVPVPNACLWLGMVPGARQLVCAQGPGRAPDGREEQAVLRIADLEAGTTRTLALPVDDPGRLSLQWAPAGAPVALLRDRQRVWLLRPHAEVGLRRLGTRAHEARFSPDGRFVVYHELGGPADERPQATLTYEDVEVEGAARALTPPHANAHSFTFAQQGRTLLFVWHFGDYKARLSQVDLATGTTRELATGVGWWIWPWTVDSVVVEPQMQVDERRVLVVTGWTLQDRTGDLVLFDLETGERRVVAHAVADFAAAERCPGCGPLNPGAPLVVVIQERLPTDRDGVWKMTMP